MAGVSVRTRDLISLLDVHRVQVDEILRKYGAVRPRLFGSVARGDAHELSDIDLMVDLMDSGGNPLLRVAGISEELSVLLGVRVDVVTASLLKDAVSASASKDLVAL